MAAARRQGLLRRGRAPARASPLSTQSLVLKHQGLIHRVARRFRGQTTSYDDLVGAGQVGLLHAARRYQLKKGYRFSTFAIPHIRSRIQRALGQEHTVRIGEKGLRQARKAGRGQVLPVAVSLEEAQHHGTEGGIARAHARALLTRIRKRAETLSPKLRSPFVTRFFTDHHPRPEPWTIRQVAKKLKISVSSVHKYEKQARQRLFGSGTTSRSKMRKSK